MGVQKGEGGDTEGAQGGAQGGAEALCHFELACEASGRDRPVTSLLASKISDDNVSNATGGGGGRGVVSSIKPHLRLQHGPPRVMDPLPVPD